MEEWKELVLEEYEGLQFKVEKLREYVGANQETLPQDEVRDIREQVSYMDSCLEVLKRRVSRLASINSVPAPQE
jgi:hypothetical protein